MGRLCPTCNGGEGRLTCPDCKGWGKEVLIDCPLKVIPAFAWSALDAAMLAEKGSWPVSGGWLDQSASCVDAVKVVWAETSRIESSILSQSK